MSAIHEPVGLFANLRSAVVERLATADAFADPHAVPVVDGGGTAIHRAVAEALTKRSAGMCLVVSVPRADPGPESPQQLRATLAVQIYERPTLNWSHKGRQIAIEDAAEAVFGALGFDGITPGWSPSAVWTRFLFDGYRIVFASTDQVVMEVLFNTSIIVRLADFPTDP
ncbi:MAG: hypothetical protein KF791_08340 [Verrucomicrobiae bacterium]|nr:hypothetical protein [Verrucomicrobiae bacterium]